MEAMYQNQTLRKTKIMSSALKLVFNIPIIKCKKQNILKQFSYHFQEIFYNKNVIVIKYIIVNKYAK